jgi:hypothetical protein
MTTPASLGNNTAIITTSSLPITPTTLNPCLVIYFDDIKTSDWNSASTSDIDSWLMAIIRKLSVFNLNATNESHDFVVGTRFLSIATRNNISNRLTEGYTITGYGSQVGSGVDLDDLE